MACLCCAATRPKPSPATSLAANRLAAQRLKNVPRLGEIAGISPKKPLLPSSDLSVRSDGSVATHASTACSFKLTPDASDSPVPAASDNPETEVPSAAALEETQQEMEERLVADLDGYLKKLQTSIQKYPKSGIGLLTVPKERFVAVVPDRTTEHALLRWCDGSLGWWDTETSFKKREGPNNLIRLFSIAKVSVSKEHSDRVIVKYKEADTTAELVLRFKNKLDAEEWSYCLWALISNLRAEKKKM